MHSPIGAVVQLVRIHACHAWGRGFESRPHRQKAFCSSESFFYLYQFHNFKHYQQIQYCMNPAVDQFMIDGCGRCKLAATPACKVHLWPQELKLLRGLLIEAGLTEEIKWGFPTYTLNNKNLIMLATFKEFCSLEFFNGHLMKDPANVLEKPGENSQTGRRIKFKNPTEVTKRLKNIQAYIQESIHIQKTITKPAVKLHAAFELPEELLAKFKSDKVLENAFYSLTPGRQRAYCLFFSAAKQSQTRTSRIAKFEHQIKLGKGMND